jgi:hypothetical protein
LSRVHTPRHPSASILSQLDIREVSQMQLDIRGAILGASLRGEPSLAEQQAYAAPIIRGEHTRRHPRRIAERTGAAKRRRERDGIEGGRAGCCLGGETAARPRSVVSTWPRSACFNTLIAFSGSSARTCLVHVCSSIRKPLARPVRSLAPWPACSSSRAAARPEAASPASVPGYPASAAGRSVLAARRRIPASGVRLPC